MSSSWHTPRSKASFVWSNNCSCLPGIKAIDKLCTFPASVLDLVWMTWGQGHDTPTSHVIFLWSINFNSSSSIRKIWTGHIWNRQMNGQGDSYILHPPPSNLHGWQHTCINKNSFNLHLKHFWKVISPSLREENFNFVKSSAANDSFDLIF